MHSDFQTAFERMQVPPGHSPAVLTTPAARLAFATAGRAVFTVLNPETGRRYTYKVRRKKSGEGFSAYVLARPDNERNYEFIGVIYPKHGGRQAIDPESSLAFRPRRHNPDTPAIAAFAWVWRRIAAGRDIAPAVLYHEGRCGRCGRLLTTPESVTAGVGPECQRRMQ